MKTAWKIIFLAFSLLHPSGIKAQTIEQCVQIGDSLQILGQNTEAIYYYQRARFFAPKEQKYTIAAKTAQAYFRKNDLDNSLKYYDFAIGGAPPDSSKWELQLEKASVLLGIQKFKEAQLEVLGLPKQLPTNWQKRKNYYLGICYIGLEEWEKAEVCFLSLLSPSDSLEKTQLSRIFKNPKMKNLQTARVMSMIVPGSGQIYAGDWRSGINSFLLTGTIAVLGAASVVDYGWSGGLWAINWVSRYYRGGIREAREAAERKNYRRKRKIQEQVNRVLEK